MKRTAVLIACLWAAVAQGQQLQISVLDSAKGVSLRGVSRPGENVFWASGSKGMVYRCTNGRKGAWLPVPGYEKSDFRGIVAKDSNEAWIMAITQPARVLHTTDGGQHWQLVYEDTAREAFLDALVKQEDQMMLLGDPLEGQHYLAESWSGHFQQSNAACWKDHLPATGEAFFASSNSGLLLQKGQPIFASGGLRSVLYTGCAPHQPTRLMQGKETTGANAISLLKNKLLVAGGDFNDPKRNDSCLAIFSWKGGQWNYERQLPATGYNSDVQWLSGRHFLTTSFSHTSLHHVNKGVLARMNAGFHALSESINGTVIAVGSGGRIALVRWAN